MYVALSYVCITFCYVVAISGYARTPFSHVVTLSYMYCVAFYYVCNTSSYEIMLVAVYVALLAVWVSHLAVYILLLVLFVSQLAMYVTHLALFLSQIAMYMLFVAMHM